MKKLLEIQSILWWVNFVFIIASSAILLLGYYRFWPISLAGTVILSAWFVSINRRASTYWKKLTMGDFNDLLQLWYQSKKDHWTQSLLFERISSPANAGVLRMKLLDGTVRRGALSNFSFSGQLEALYQNVLGESLDKVVKDFALIAKCEPADREYCFILVMRRSVMRFLFLHGRCGLETTVVERLVEELKAYDQSEVFSWLQTAATDLADHDAYQAAIEAKTVYAINSQSKPWYRFASEHSELAPNEAYWGLYKGLLFKLNERLQPVAAAPLVAVV